MHPFHKQRLQQLADHLRHGQLAHKVFNFSIINADGDGRSYFGICGSNGCALGELPAVFPEFWKWTDLLQPGTFDSAMSFFGLTEEEADHLFMPECQQPAKFGGKILQGDATRQEVADNIDEFVRLKAMREADPQNPIYNIPWGRLSAWPSSQEICLATFVLPSDEEADTHQEEVQPDIVLQG